MTPTDATGWTTSRPQDMEGEFSGAIALRGYNHNNNFYDNNPSLFGTANIPVEDVAEVMMYVAHCGQTGNSTPILDYFSWHRRTMMMMSVLSG